MTAYSVIVYYTAPSAKFGYAAVNRLEHVSVHAESPEEARNKAMMIKRMDGADNVFCGAVLKDWRA